jgi:acetyltransferase-like isoleucine patch superfamily enzyme
MLNKLFWILNFVRLSCKRGIKCKGFVKVDLSVEFILEKNAKIILNKGVQIRKGTTLFAQTTLELKENVFIGHYSTLAFVLPTIIEANTMIAEQVSIRDHDHNYSATNKSLLEKGNISSPVVIMSNVWIASKSTITRGVTLSEFSVVGANAVVTKDVPAYTIVGGIPAKFIKKYS